MGDDHEYADNLVGWLENGRKALDYMGADERFTAASFGNSMEEQGIAVNRNDLIALIDNMQSLSKQCPPAGAGPRICRLGFRVH